ncbi:MAG: DUF2017 domain-containing protein [Cryobacterium sp.]|uniref:DUF2017 family protein n=1 Tax=unclassified Cryobacterium TaxID=2649013 RepID=UPI001A1DA728|nr:MULTISPECIES: DUF2017 family protein [unclassified Cryobacterium]MCY7403325.1 DUF2017 domain-containing protein [Cryobacterium sp.]MEC5154414.1 hypothetical protein [Cryobacterium sp. CAN_C3]
MSGLRRFTLHESGALLGRFEPIEVDLLRLATSQLVDMLDAGAADPQLAASDGVFGRLLPVAYPDDAAAAADFRRFTATDLLKRKAQNAQIVLGSLGTDPASAADAASEGDTAGLDTEDRQPVTISLDADAVQAWLRSLTDLRLTLADRLQISPDGVVHLVGDDARFLGELYDWLGMLQEELVYTIDV